MKLEVTPRDKVLLIFLSVLLIMAAYLLLGILPLYRANRDMTMQLSSAEADMEDKERKIARLSEAGSVNLELKEDLARVQSALYPMMESREIDRILTGLAYDYGLSVRRMEIRMPEKASELLPFGEEKEKKAGAAEDPESDSVYHAFVLMEVVGSRADEDGLLDEISQKRPGIRTLSMRRITAKGRGLAEDGSVEDILELELEISMCRKIAE